MPTCILSTCGTSLLTKTAGDQRGLVTRHANARRPEDVPEADRQALEAIIAAAQKALHRATAQDLCGLSAELHAIVRFCGGSLEAGRGTHHLLVATDTWLGETTATTIAEVLTAAGHSTEVRRIRDLRTAHLDEFRAAMADLVHLCTNPDHGLARWRQAGYRVVFNLTGGFKTVQGVLQVLGMLLADESIYVFENEQELLRLPRLPITLDAAATVRQHQEVFRRLQAGLPVTAAEASGVPDTLLLEVDGAVTLSPWGELVWEQGRRAVLGERLWEPVTSRLRFGPGFTASTRGCSAEELVLLNERLLDLARHLHGGANLNRLDFKKLRAPHGPSTHEADAWAKAGAKRLFGHFEDDVFVLDRLAEGLH